MLEKDTFLKEYNVIRQYEQSGLSWNSLMEIYDDYSKQYYSKLQDLAEQLVNELKKAQSSSLRGRKVHAVFGRAKDPEHLIEKIIRKVGGENSQKYKDIKKDNYRTIITDLIGIRMLVLVKEDWKVADEVIRALFHDFEEKPVSYVCYGDREIFDERLLRVDYTNKGYRSQHYIVSYHNCFCEIQVRTLAEEVHGEFDHRIRYPYQVANKFLKRYSKIVSKNVSELDDLISTCLEVDSNLLEDLNQKFKEDRYVDWSKRKIYDTQHEESDTLSSDNVIKRNISDVRDLVKKKMITR